MADGRFTIADLAGAMDALRAAEMPTFQQSRRLVVLSPADLEDPETKRRYQAFRDVRGGGCAGGDVSPRIGFDDLLLVPSSDDRIRRQ